MTNYFTGTGWPQSDQDSADMDALQRAFAFGEATRYEPTVRLIRETVGLEKGQPLSDALPLTSRTRERLRSILGPSFDIVPCEWIIGRLRAVMREAEDRDSENAQATSSGDATCLYRLHDEAGRLLYVGIAFDPDAREKQHRYTQRWAPLIAHREDEWFDTRPEALSAELHAIRNESPMFNEAGRPRLPSLAGEVFA